MAMAGLGKPAEIWRWPFHYYVAVRTEYLKIMGMSSPEPTKTEELAPGITVERFDY